jgi:uncharacterized protein YpmB
MENPADKRRSERKNRSIAVHLSAALPDGTTAEAQAQTLVVNQHGAKIHADLNLLLGCPVKIRVEGSDEPVEAVVAWVSKDSPGVFGVELASPEAPWDDKKK